MSTFWTLIFRRTPHLNFESNSYIPELVSEDDIPEPIVITDVILELIPITIISARLSTNRIVVDSNEDILALMNRTSPTNVEASKFMWL